MGASNELSDSNIPTRFLVMNVSSIDKKIRPQGKYPKFAFQKYRSMSHIQMYVWRSVNHFWSVVRIFGRYLSRPTPVRVITLIV